MRQDVFYLFSDFSEALACEGLEFKQLVLDVDSEQFGRFWLALGNDRRVVPYGGVVDGEVRVQELRLQTAFGEALIREASE